MKIKEIASITIIAIIIITIIFISQYLNRGNLDGDAILPEQMQAEVSIVPDGYKITVYDVGDYYDDNPGWSDNSLNISEQFRWRIWDATNIVQIDGGQLPSNTANISFTDANTNNVIDVGDYYLISNLAHSYGNYYFIIDSGTNTNYIIHEKISE